MVVLRNGVYVVMAAYGCNGRAKDDEKRKGKGVRPGMLAAMGQMQINALCLVSS